MPNQFVWYDVMTNDINGAKAFYTSVVGWDASDSGMANQSYTILSAGPTMIGGMMPLPDQARAAGTSPCWTGYIGVDDVDRFAERVKAAGGAIHRPPEDIPGVGRFAVAADPHGGIFILFCGTSDQPPTPAPPGTPGHVGWHELHAGNGEKDFDFYSGLFGWTRDRAMPMGEMGTYQIFAAGNGAIGAMMTKMPNTPAPFWLYYFNVGAIDAAADRVKKGGGKVINGPMEVPGGQWIVHCLDPQGAMFALVAPKR